jgi:periplasmic divalent cation tolerance protein
MTDKILVLSTCSDATEAEVIARRLVESRLAACVNVVAGVRSIYHWRGAVEQASECLLVIKSRRELFDQLRSEVEKLHSYEVPELLALTVIDGSPAYLSWLDHELRPEP